jgi:hypothetical protein
MANNAQANWDVVIIVYGSEDPFVKMADNGYTCLFHWTQLLDRHTKQLFKPEFQDQHICLCC